MWRGSIAYAFNQESKGRRIAWNEVKFPPRSFLWDHWDEPHVSLGQPEVYWRHMEEGFQPLFRSLGLKPDQARRAAKNVQAQNRALKLPVIVWQDGKVVEKPA